MNANNSMKLKDSKSKTSLGYVDQNQIVNLLDTPVESVQTSTCVVSPKPSTFRKTNFTSLDKRTETNSVPESPMPESNNKQPSMDNPLKSLDDFKEDFKMMT